MIHLVVHEISQFDDITTKHGRGRSESCRYSSQISLALGLTHRLQSNINLILMRISELVKHFLSHHRLSADNLSET